MYLDELVVIRCLYQPAIVMPDLVAICHPKSVKRGMAVKVTIAISGR